MTENPYAQLADALDRLPNGFPRTAAGVELLILKKIFSPEEAALAAQLGGTMETAAEIALRSGQPAEEITRQLLPLAKRELVWCDRQEGRARFRLAPFIVGIYESMVGGLDHELAHLIEDYMTSGGAAGIMGPEPALQRVVPAHGTVKSEWILPYEDVHAILLAARTFHLGDCICREQKSLMGEPCSFPSHVCLGFSSAERPTPAPGDISQAEALALLDRCEEIGLVHSVSNVMEGMGYVCNCCGCCCGVLRGITDWGVANSVAHANYYAVIDPELCSGCGTCIQRCQVGAISEGDGGASVVDRARCIGCGLCASGCPNEVAHLVRKPEAESIHPPVDFGAWERERLANRGMAN